MLNPESADAIFARESNVFVADKLSDMNKQQAEMLNVHWVELRSDNGYKRFGKVLEALHIPHTLPNADIEKLLDNALSELFQTK
jgi:hypothetical protein